MLQSLATSLSTCQSTFNQYLIFYLTFYFFPVISDISESGSFWVYLRRFLAFTVVRPQSPNSPHMFIKQLSCARHCPWCRRCTMCIGKQNRKTLHLCRAYILAGKTLPLLLMGWAFLHMVKKWPLGFSCFELLIYNFCAFFFCY